MKTNVTLSSNDRDLFGVTIKQQTTNSFISVSDLQKAYELARWQHGWNDKRINDILSSIATKERIYYLLKEKDLIKAEISAFMAMVDKEGIVTVLKGLQLWKTSGRGENKSVYCNPYIWVLIAMELNPMLYAKVITWLTDTLVFDRIEAGGEFMPMNAAIKNIVAAPNYPTYAMEINKVVFGKHISGMRNIASAKELKKITEIEKYIVKIIDAKFAKTQEEIILAIQSFKS